ncbi:crotonase/enoyl-CoA hydratase family protein [Chelatococcus reniformis]|uniref:Enoyl-CoA hydratase n=1 Tax=Chelatococcus reniformis TaxID=1494448 RepID=A0A916XI26_9HYPH|nr:crotonase/enoyl-CoA hydratase family protein [Chelatococcus reniformis]GGC72039.1 enoyl-CoA hydratase [Chelatococcus reniformis]
MTDSVKYEQDGGVVTLTLNEPDTRNALSPAIVDAIEAHCARINKDMSVSCVIVTGAGDSFSSGGNVKEMRDRSGAMFGGIPAEVRRGYQHGIQRIPLAMYNLEVPAIAAVNGFAIGAGCDLTLMCDIRIAADDAQFAESFMRVGLVSGDGGAWFLPRVVGLSRAYEMTFTGNFIKAEQALAWGLASYVVPKESLLDEARKMARQIAAQPPHSIRLCKKLVRDSAAISLPTHLEIASGMQALAQHTADQHEAVSAFLDKRKPAFKGA